jgi:hypothetical protein
MGMKSNLFFCPKLLERNNIPTVVMYVLVYTLCFVIKPKLTIVNSLMIVTHNQL